MKRISLFSFLIASLFSIVPASAQDTKTETIPVSGNCGMCKSTIEKAARSAGAKDASWDTETHLLTLTYASAVTSSARVQDSIAGRGYDTRDVKGSDAAYQKLPGCCKYDRSGTARHSGPSAEGDQVASITAVAAFTSADLQANGLTCAMCSNAINKALKTLPCIENVKADIKHSSFHIDFKPGVEPSADAIRQAVEKAGFSVGKLELNGDLQGVAVGADKHVKIGSSLYHFIGVGEQVLGTDAHVTVVDKNFLTDKQFRKISAASKMACVQTGKMESCCKDAGDTPDARVYHVTL